MLKRFVLVCLLGSLPNLSAMAAEDINVRTFKLPKAKQLELYIPKAWTDTLKQPPRNLPPTITLTTKPEDKFKFLVTIGDQPLSDEKARSIAEKSLEDAKPQALEQVIQLKEIIGPQNKGYYFYATDKAPKQGEYKYMTQGVIRTDGGSLIFTLLSNDGAEPEVAGMLESLRTAKYKAAAKATSAQTATKSPVTTAEAEERAQKNAKWSNAKLDLTHCLSRSSNAEIIRCVE